MISTIRMCIAHVWAKKDASTYARVRGLAKRDIAEDHSNLESCRTHRFLLECPAEVCARGISPASIHGRGQCTVRGAMSLGKNRRTRGQVCEDDARIAAAGKRKPSHSRVSEYAVAAWATCDTTCSPARSRDEPRRLKWVMRSSLIHHDVATQHDGSMCLKPTSDSIHQTAYALAFRRLCDPNAESGMIRNSHGKGTKHPMANSGRVICIIAIGNTNLHAFHCEYPC